MIYSIKNRIIAQLAALIRRHPFKADIQAVDLSEAEQELRLYLKNYIDDLSEERREQIYEKVNRLVDEIDPME